MKNADQGSDMSGERTERLVKAFVKAIDDDPDIKRGDLLSALSLLFRYLAESNQVPTSSLVYLLESTKLTLLLPDLPVARLPKVTG